MTPAAIRQRIAELEAIKSAAAASDAHNADTAWAVALGQLADEPCAQLGGLYHMTPEDNERACGECPSCAARAALERK